ncbi:MAG TPA: hypothetical protein VLG49_06500 [Rhabdochlamydiaceae bacterium]|nr:hypothetical protein [Rhabdochlamydiaceae bacterium]
MELKIKLLTNMSVKFWPIGSNPSHTCAICREESNGELLAHDGLGQLHPMHQECIKQTAIRKKIVQLIGQIHLNCPYCNKSGTVDSSYLFSWKERIIYQLDNVFKNLNVFKSDLLTDYSSGFLGANLAAYYLGFPWWNTTSQAIPPREVSDRLTVILVSSITGALASKLVKRKQPYVALITSYIVTYIASRTYLSGN